MGPGVVVGLDGWLVKSTAAVLIGLLNEELVVWIGAVGLLIDWAESFLALFNGWLLVGW